MQVNPVQVFITLDPAMFVKPENSVVMAHFKLVTAEMYVSWVPYEVPYYEDSYGI